MGYLSRIASSIVGIAICASATNANAQQASPGSSSVIATSNSPDSLEEIIVTSRKREERLQDVPIAVTALSSEALVEAGIPDTAGLAKAVPGLFYRDFSSVAPSLYIRGVGTRSYDGASESSVGTFVDGVYMGTYDSAIQDLAAVQQVEVLRGPQGSLFGRNTIGGAINITTAQPTNEFVARATATDAYDPHLGAQAFSGSALASGPLIGDRLFGLVSYSYNNPPPISEVEGQDRYTNRSGTQTVRARLVYKPDDVWSVDLSFDHFQSIDNSWAFKADTVDGTRPNVFLINPFLPEPAISPDPHTVALTPGEGGANRAGTGWTGTVHFTPAAVDLTSISSYRTSTSGYNVDIDASSLYVTSNPSAQNSSQFSEEIRVASRSGGVGTFGDRLNWLAGLYYYEQHVDRTDTSTLGPDSELPLLIPGLTFASYSFSQKVDTNSWAAFGQEGYHFTDRLTLDVGLRYSSDRKSADLGCVDPLAAFCQPYTTSPSGSWHSTDPTATLSYKPSADLMFYGGYAQGYKSGAFQFLATSAEAANSVVKPEKLDAYQLGVRSDWWDHRVRVNLSTFYYNYDNLQVSHVEAFGPTFLEVLTNAAKSTLYGGELEGFAWLTPALRVDYFVTYLDAKYDTYQYSALIDYSGNTMPRSPKETAMVALNFDQPIGPGKLEARVAANYTASFYFEPDDGVGDPGVQEGATTLFDASLGFKAKNFGVTLWGKNLTNKEYRLNELSFPGSQLLDMYAPGRTVGITFDAHY